MATPVENIERQLLQAIRNAELEIISKILHENTTTTKSINTQNSLLCSVLWRIIIGIIETPDPFTPFLGFTKNTANIHNFIKIGVLLIQNGATLTTKNNIITSSNDLLDKLKNVPFKDCELFYPEEVIAELSILGIATGRDINKLFTLEAESYQHRQTPAMLSQTIAPPALIFSPMPNSSKPKKKKVNCKKFSQPFQFKNIKNNPKK